MLGLVSEMFPGTDDPGNIDRTFLEPACGSGNFLVEILRRKLAFVTTGRYGSGEDYEHAVLRCLASVYAIDICHDNVDESRHRMRSVIDAHVDKDPTAEVVSTAFADAAEVVLQTNVIRADALADGHAIELVEYQPGPAGTFMREWSWLDPAAKEPTLFTVSVPRRDQRPIHYSELSRHPGPVLAASLRGAA